MYWKNLEWLGMSRSMSIDLYARRIIFFILFIFFFSKSCSRLSSIRPSSSYFDKEKQVCCHRILSDIYLFFRVFCNHKNTFTFHIFVCRFLSYKNTFTFRFLSSSAAVVFWLCFSTIPLSYGTQNTLKRATFSVFFNRTQHARNYHIWFNSFQWRSNLFSVAWAMLHSILIAACSEINVKTSENRKCDNNSEKQNNKIKCFIPQRAFFLFSFFRVQNNRS